MSEILFKNATIYPITSSKKVNADLLVVDGKIKEIGYNLRPKPETSVIECNEKYLLPGFIDVHTHLGLYDEGTGWAGNDANETIEQLNHSHHIYVLWMVFIPLTLPLVMQ